MPTSDIEGIKRLIADQYPPDVGLRCVQVQIPDDDSYLQVLAGFVAILGKNWAWTGTPEAREERSQQWENAYAATDWEGCMDCERIIECITSDPDTQDAFLQFMLNQINSNTDIRNALQQIVQQTPGEENPSVAQHENLNTSTAECDSAAFCGAMIFLVNWMHANNMDFLQRLVAADSPAAASSALSKNIPGYNTGVLGETLSTVVSFFSTAFLTNYESAVTQPYLDGVVNELRCLGAANCSLTLAQLYAVFSSRVGYTPVSLDTFAQGFAFTVTGVWSGPNIADVIFFCQLGAFMFMNGFVDYVGLNPLSNALTSGLDSPSDDCEEFDPCPSTWCRHITGEDLHTLFLPYPGPYGPQAYWSGTGYERNLEATDSRITIYFNPMFTINCTTIRVVNTEAITNGDTNTKTIYRLNSSLAVTGVIAASPCDADVTFDLNTSVQAWNVDCVSDASIEPGAAVAGGEITDVYISGYGTEPTWGEAC